MNKKPFRWTSKLRARCLEAARVCKQERVLLRRLRVLEGAR